MSALYNQGQTAQHTFTDPGHACRNLQNGFGTQYSLIIKSFGFSTIQTTALNIPAGAAQIISITASTVLLRRYPV